MSETTNRGKFPQPPPNGWPVRPAGSTEELASIVLWLKVPEGNRANSNIIWSNWDAEKHARAIAGRLLEALSARETSPTLSEMEERIAELRQTAARLRKLVAAFTGPQSLSKIVANQAGFFVSDRTALGGNYRLADWNEIFERPLSLLIDEARQHESELRASSKGGAGKGRLYERVKGDPRLEFARACAKLLQASRNGDEGEIPPTKDILELMEKLWTYATGLAPEANALTGMAAKGYSSLSKPEPTPAVTPRIRRLIGQKF